MRLGAGLAVLLALQLFATPVAAARDAASAALERRLEAALSARALRGARVGAHVAAEDGRELFARDPDRALIPASNMKILTAIGALERFGPSHRFTTQIFASAAPDAEGGVDWLAVRGGGDPGLTSEDCWRLAADLRLLGLRRVREGVVLDASLFDTEWWHPSWGTISARAYHAPIGALTVNYGAYGISAAPGARAGEPLRVALDPPVPYLALANLARTGARRTRRGLSIDRSAGDGVENVKLSGALPAGTRGVVHYRSVLDPVRYAGSVLRAQLEAVGIEVSGDTRVGPVPAGAELLLAHQGRSLAQIVSRFLKYSNNAIGEGLVKALAVSEGAVGSWAAGIPALARALAAAGVDTQGFTLIDGSGLSYENRVTARGLVAALSTARRSFRFGPEFVTSLPIANADGTLAERVDAAPLAVRAKTGLLTGVTALSGYADLGEGRVAVFSVLVNGHRSSPGEVMAAVDGFVAALVAAGGAAVEPPEAATASAVATPQP